MDNASKLRILYRSVKKLRAVEADVIQRETVLTGTEIEVESENDRKICTWLHRPEVKKAPLLLDLHGGGFVMGNPCKNDAFCEWIARTWQINVVSVGYSLAPENPYPAAVEDVCAVIRWYQSHAEELEIDAGNIYLQGYSAGANLAFASLLHQPKKKRIPVKGIIAHYPFFDAATSPALKQVRDIDLPIELMEAFNIWYAGENSANNPEISPVFAENQAYKHFPKTLISAVVGDSLFDEAMTLAVCMKSQGVNCTFVPVQNAYHGYIEDAVNTKVYYATSFPETRKARPEGYYEAAEAVVCFSLNELFGEPENAVMYQKFWKKDDRE